MDSARFLGKFVERFGVDAMKFVNSPVGRELCLRGINARVVRAGVVREGDVVRAITEAKTHAGAARLLGVHPSTISQAVRKARLVERGLVPAAVRRPQLVVVRLSNDPKTP